MGNDASFVAEIRKTVEAKLFTNGDNTYSNVQLVNLPPPQHFNFPTIELYSLDSLVRYVADNRDAAIHESTVQINCSHDQVELFSEPKGEQRVRDVLVSVEAGAAPYNFGTQRDLESFRISLLTEFEDTQDRAEILKFISNVKNEAIAISTDDGVSQTAVVKAGLATLAQATVPSPVTLRPIRTFIEVAQPEGMFLFRMKSEKELWCSLHEIHTKRNTWKISRR